MPDDDAPQTGVRIPMPHAMVVDWRLIGAILAAICAGTWFVASQSARIAENAQIVESYHRDSLLRREVYDHEFQTQGAVIGTIDNRLTRIEAKIELLLAGQATGNAK